MTPTPARGGRAATDASSATAARTAHVNDADDGGGLRSYVLDAPVGELTIVRDVDGIVAVLWPGEHRTILRTEPARLRSGDDALLDDAAQQLREYFRGGRTSFHLPLAPRGTDFQQRAWKALQAIPFGETRSYAAQADAIGSPRAVRAVGAANGRNPISIIVPCHRVIGANGSLTGFAAGVATKQWLLEHEQRVSGTGDGRLF